MTPDRRTESRDALQYAILCLRSVGLRSAFLSLSIGCLLVYGATGTGHASAHVAVTCCYLLTVCIDDVCLKVPLVEDEVVVVPERSDGTTDVLFVNLDLGRARE